MFILGITAAGCSSGGISAGHGSPESAVKGGLDDLMNGHGNGAWCSYLDPSIQATCRSVAASDTATGNYTINSQDIQGTQALVAITGNLCFRGPASGNACESNNNPNKGMPPGAGSFSVAYAAASSKSKTLSPVQCVEIGGSWYVTMGSSGSSTPTSSPTTGVTPTTQATPPTTATTAPSPATTTPTTTPSPATTTATTTVP